MICWGRQCVRWHWTVSLMAHWSQGCTKAFWQTWQDKAAQMHGTSTTPVDPLRLEETADRGRSWSLLSLHFLGWLAFVLFTSLLSSWGDLFNNPAKPFPSDATGGSLLLCGSSTVCAGVSFRVSWTHLSTIAGSGSSKKLILKRGSMKQAIFMTFFALSVYLLLRSSLMTLFISLVKDGSLLFSTSTSQVMWSRTGLMADRVTRVSEASASVNLLSGSKSWHIYSMTLMSASLGIRCHTPLSPASVAQIGCCWLGNRSIIL